MIQNQYNQTITIEQLQYNFWSTFLIRHKHFILTTSRKVLFQSIVRHQTRMHLIQVIENTSQRRGLNMKSGNILILCCDNNPLANTKAPHVLHLSIIRLVLGASLS
jgi:hypothetical protein